MDTPRSAIAGANKSATCRFDQPAPFASGTGSFESDIAMRENRRMEFTIPEGSPVQIFIGSAPLSTTAAPINPERRVGLGRPLLRGLLAAVLLLGAFEAGRFTLRHGGTGDVASAAAAVEAPNGRPGVAGALREQRAFPEQAPPAAAQLAAPLSPQTQAGAQVPLSFLRQLHQAPTVAPPPGQRPASPGQPANPFGLSQ